MMLHSLRKSRSSASLPSLQSPPANPLRSEVEESLPRVTIPNAQPSWRSLSRSSYLRPVQTPKSSQKGEHQPQKVDQINDMPTSARASVVPSTGLVGHARSESLWSTNDSYLPRAKPPPPLRPIECRWNRSKINPFRDPTTCGQPSTSRYASSRQSPKSRSTTPRSLRSNSDTPVLEISSDQSNGPVDVVPPTLTQSNTLLSTDSEASSADISFAPSEFGPSWNLKWTPPISWAGPPGAVSADEDDGSKPVEGYQFTSKKNAQGSSQDSGGLNYPRSLKQLWRPDDLGGEVGEPGGQVFDTLSSDVTVKIQCYENHEWHEKPVADIIPMLRELKIK